MKVVVVFTMKGCPYCVEIKEILKQNEIEFVERDIHDYEDEYSAFVEAKNNEFVPSLMLMTLDNNENYSNVKLLAPDDDYIDIYEGVNMIIDYLSE
jgi:glutaredoxin